MTISTRTGQSAKRSRLLPVGAAAFALVFVAACGNGGDENGGAGADEFAHPEVVADLEGAHEAIVDGFEEFGDDQTQFFLADDVSAPEQNYGMWVLPVDRSEETEYMTQQVDIVDGEYVIEAEAAEDGTTYEIDQDGNVTVNED